MNEKKLAWDRKLASMNLLKRWWTKATHYHIWVTVKQMTSTFDRFSTLYGIREEGIKVACDIEECEICGKRRAVYDDGFRKQIGSAEYAERVRNK